MDRYYVSVTGLTLKSNLYLPKFLSYAIPASRQAAAAEGNLFSDQQCIDGVHHTLTVWEDKQSMRKYMLSGAHAKAMKIFREFANLEYGTKTHGYESDSIPSWKEAIEIWDTEAKLHGKPRPSKPPSNAGVQTTAKSVFGNSFWFGKSLFG